MKINKEAQEVIDRLTEATKSYGKVFNYDKVVAAMQKHYNALGVPMPEVVCIENMEEAYKKYAARGAARDAAWDAAWGAAWDAARGAAWDAARGAASLNIGLKDPIQLKFQSIELPLLEALEAGLGFFFPMQDQLILVPVPTFRMNTNNLLHSDNFPAIQWKDGTGYYYLNGVKFPEDLWTKVVSGKIPFQDILAIVDIDQRTQAMRYGDVNEFVKHTKGELLDSYSKIAVNGKEITYKLYKISKGEVFQKDAYYAVYDCPSTDKMYMSGVEPCTKVSEAMAWKHHTTSATWKKLVPLMHES